MFDESTLRALHLRAASDPAYAAELEADRERWALEQAEREAEAANPPQSRYGEAATEKLQAAYALHLAHKEVRTAEIISMLIESHLLLLRRVEELEEQGKEASEETEDK